MLYHGTSQDFSKLDPKKSGATFFTADRELAIAYAQGFYTSQAGSPTGKIFLWTVDRSGWEYDEIDEAINPFDDLDEFDAAIAAALESAGGVWAPCSATGFGMELAVTDADFLADAVRTTVDHEK